MSHSAEPTTQGLTRRSVRAGLWMAGLTGIENILILVRTLILSRLLEPREFGLMGMGFIAITLAEVLSQTGFSRALIQRRGDPRPFLDTFWCVAAVRGLLLAAVILAFAPILGGYFRTPEVVPVIRAIAIAPAINGLASPAWSLLERELRLGRFGLPRAAGAGIDLIVTTVLAFPLRSVWAMVAGYVASCLVFVIMTFIIAPHRPRLRLDFEQARQLYSFGRYVFRYEIVTYFVEQLDRLVVGRVRNATDLGFYTFASRLATLPNTSVFGVLLRVSFPAFSSIQYEPGRIRDGFGRLMALMALVSFPIAAGLAITAPEMIPLVFGERWSPITRTFQLLCLLSAAATVASTCAMVAGGLGKPELASRASMIRLVVMGAVVIPATWVYGIEGAAAAAALGAAVAASYLIHRVFRTVGLAPRPTALIFGVPAVSCVLMAAAAFAVRAAAIDLSRPLALALLVLAGGATYIVAVAGVDRLYGSFLTSCVREVIRSR